MIGNKWFKRGWLLFCFLASFVSQAATIGPSLAAKLAGSADSASAGTVIVAFNTTNGLNAAHFSALSLAGVNKGLTLQHLGMVAFPATAGQVRALASNFQVRSIWLNGLEYLNNQTRILTGVDRARTDANFTRMNGGMPVSGKGNFAVEINDSGIDGTHSDVHYRLDPSAESRQYCRRQSWPRCQWPLERRSRP